ncbi:WD40 repeat-like protein [Fistulina hepatica ATCC 64428]|uniref:WD40 repeat-like protein n=1 Tax=Fistulina hepatica ATCC 64428 TaxID=1128425 RepID=A0A0D7A753_9AGAR|nr:WD40 repeat-like protein [Fistulina hepatica ATCC 64428]
MSAMSSSQQLCDTLPSARIGQQSSGATPAALASPETQSSRSATSTMPRKLCVRHQRMADEGTNLQLQQALDALPVSERQAVTNIWSSFSSSSHPRRALILQGLLTLCCFSQLSLLSSQLQHLIRIDPFAVLPKEISLNILAHLDAISLCRAAQVSRTWKVLADDDVLWRGICEQHIGQKCRKCGWALPVLQKGCSLDNVPTALEGAEPPPRKRARLDDNVLVSPVEGPAPDPLTCPWKNVYSERMTVERNWRRGRYKIRNLSGHTDGIMCLQLCECLSHPSFPVLITGSYDCTARVWNLATGATLHVLEGHTRAIRALQFDDFKLVTGSMDCTVRVWDWRRGQCIRTLAGHAEGVVSINFDSNVLASGSVDASIRIWNLRTGGAFVLHGHEDWVNAVQLWDANGGGGDCAASCEGRIDAGKMLFSGSDDCTIRLWDLNLRTCVRVFNGHQAQVQCISLVCASDESEDDDHHYHDMHASEDPHADVVTTTSSSVSVLPRASRRPVLISGSLDNTVKTWDIDTGEARSTCFGHISGVWAVAADKRRMVSGSQDRTIKVWSREDAGRCEHTLVGHEGAISCIAIGEDKIVSGGDDADVKVWSFTG